MSSVICGCLLVIFKGSGNINIIEDMNPLLFNDGTIAGLGGLWCFVSQARLAGSTCRLAVAVHMCEAQGELLPPALGLGYWTPLPRM